jgi:hypothetical protein
VAEREVSRCSETRDRTINRRAWSSEKNGGRHDSRLSANVGNLNRRNAYDVLGSHRMAYGDLQADARDVAENRTRRPARSPKWCTRAASFVGGRPERVGLVAIGRPAVALFFDRDDMPVLRENGDYVAERDLDCGATAVKQPQRNAADGTVALVMRMPFTAASALAQYRLKIGEP